MLTVRDLQRPGLFPVSFDLADGECIAVQGPSGSGKSLLLRTLADLDPNQGDVCLDGQPRHDIPGPLWRRRVVYLPSESGWWDDRVADHFSDWDQAVALVETLRLPAQSQGWTVQRLSTGERQRLALVRALLLQPRVLLLDEPTSGLDNEASEAVERVIDQYRRTGTGVIWVTHDTAQARRIAKRCLFLENGRVHEGSPL